ncbi:MAG: glycine cleavage system aminomethyltransferase GcvT [Christensenellales bacterium]
MRTPLYDIHVKYGGKIVEFAGYELPVQYSSIIAEHLAVRNGAGLFDVSHMGEILFTGKGALRSLNHLMTNDFTDMSDGQVRYSMMLYDNGTVVDDVLVYKVDEDTYLVVVNASNKDKDYEWMKANKLPETLLTDMSDNFAELALQGPDAESVMGELIDLSEINPKNYTFKMNVEIAGNKCIVSRTGYTGEKGFEIYTPVHAAETIYDLIMKSGRVTPCGLGARDTLRLEAGMPLYGHELSDGIMGHEAGLNFCIKYNKDFIGKEALLNNPPVYKRIGLTLSDRGIAREGAIVYNSDIETGYVTSGTMSPLTGKAIAMARVKIDALTDDLIVDVRGRKLRAELASLPFYRK